MFFLWLGQSVSNSGDAIFAVAVFWLVLESGNSAFDVGLLSTVIYASQILFGSLGGVLVDRFNRRNILIVGNFMQALLTGAISFLYVAHIQGLPILVGAVFTIYGLATLVRASVNAIVPTIVIKDDLAASNSLLSLTGSFSTLVNYSIGGLIIAVAGPALPIVYDSFTFCFAAAMALLIAKSYGSVHPKESVSYRHPQSRFFAEVVRGLAYIKYSSLLLQVVVFGTIVNFFGTGAITLMAPYARIWIHGGSDAYGFILSAFSLGGIVASLIFGKLNLRSHVGKTLLLGIAGAGIMVLMMGLVSSLPPALFLSFSFGFLIVFANLPIQTLLQATIPSDVFGRVYTALTTTVSVAQPFSASLAGYVAQSITVGPAFVFFGLSTTSFTAAAYFTLGNLKNSRY